MIDLSKPDYTDAEATALCREILGEAAVDQLCRAMIPFPDRIVGGDRIYDRVTVLTHLHTIKLLREWKQWSDWVMPLIQIDSPADKGGTG